MHPYNSQKLRKNYTLIPHEHNLFSDSINNEEKESDLASISVSLKKHPAANPFPQPSAVKRRVFFVYHRWEKSADWQRSWMETEATGDAQIKKLP
jgi:hypothetical protein